MHRALKFSRLGRHSSTLICPNRQISSSNLRFQQPERPPKPDRQIIDENLKSKSKIFNEELNNNFDTNPFFKWTLRLAFWGGVVLFGTAQAVRFYHSTPEDESTAKEKFEKAVKFLIENEKLPYYLGKKEQISTLPDKFSSSNVPFYNTLDAKGLFELTSRKLLKNCVLKMASQNF